MNATVGGRPARRRARLTCAGATLAALVALLCAAPAPASYQKEFAQFAGCPVNAPGVTTCVNSVVTSGEFKLGSETVPINKTVVLQGGLNAVTKELVGASLSRTPLTVPGGLLGIEGLGGEVTATAELAAPVHINLANLTGGGPLVELPVKVKLDNPLLGGACFIGSDSEPVTLALTDGTTSPPPPNKPISGSKGTLTFTALGRIENLSGNSLVENAFPAPGVNGCGGLLAFLIDPLVDVRAGLPAAAGHNAAVLDGSIAQAEARVVAAEHEIPAFGRCQKAEPVSEGGKNVFKGRFGEPTCVTEAVESAKVGRFEWTPGPGSSPKFSGSGAHLTLQTAGGTKVTCTGSSQSGQYTGTKTLSLALTLTGCKSSLTRQACQAASAASGEIPLAPLTGTLGLISDTEPNAPLVGLDLTTGGGPLAKFECGAGPVTVSGSVIANIAIDKMLASPALTFKQEGGRQLPEAFEESAPDTLTATSGAGTEAAALSGVLKLPGEEPIEVNARPF